MPKIEKSLVILDSMTTGSGGSAVNIDSRALLIVTVVFLCFMLGVPAMHIDIMLWYALYPIVMSPFLGMSYTSVFLQSLIVLPLILLLGVFNPIVDRSLIAVHGDITITRGWLLFFGLLIRGLLSMQALLILIRSIGFIGIVRTLSKLWVPKFIVTQLMMVFRYIRVMIEEGLTMKAARDARSFGRTKLTLKMWGVLIGQLFLRSIDRAERVHRAMLARGFSGEIPYNYSLGGKNSSTRGNIRFNWTWSSTIYLIAWSLIFLFLRLFNLSLLFVK